MTGIISQKILYMQAISCIQSAGGDKKVYRLLLENIGRSRVEAYKYKVFRRLLCLMVSSIRTYTAVVFGSLDKLCVGMVG